MALSLTWDILKCLYVALDKLDCLYVSLVSGTACTTGMECDRGGDQAGPRETSKGRASGSPGNSIENLGLLYKHEKSFISDKKLDMDQILTKFGQEILLLAPNIL